MLPRYLNDLLGHTWPVWEKLKFVKVIKSAHLVIKTKQRISICFVMYRVFDV